MSDRSKAIKERESLLIDQFISEKITKNRNSRRIEELKLTNENFIDWLKEQNSFLYMQFIELLSDEINDSVEISTLNNILHIAGITVASMSSIAAYAIELKPPPELVSHIFSWFEWAFPFAVATLALEGLLDAKKALFNKETEDRWFKTFEGLYRSTLASCALCVSIGVLATSTFLLPSLFLGITLGIAYKEHRQYKKAEEEIEKLREEINFIKAGSPAGLAIPMYITPLLSSQDQDQDKDDTLKTAKMEERIKILEVQKENYTKLRNGTLIAGILSVACFMAAAAVPVAAPALIIAGLLLFTGLNFYKRHYNKEANKEIETIKQKLPEEDKRRLENNCLTNYSWSAISVFKADKNACKKELVRMKNLALSRV